MNLEELEDFKTSLKNLAKFFLEGGYTVNAELIDVLIVFLEKHKIAGFDALNIFIQGALKEHFEVLLHEIQEIHKQTGEELN